MNISLHNIVSASDIQKNYRKIFNKVKRTKNPVVVMRGSEPEVVIIDINTLEDIEQRLEELEIEVTLKAIEEGEKEFKEGKTITSKSLANLL
ncbi:MAG: type II toxin-antitoxin system prevent-host-death family antitoxin [Candidatus Levybacteria bacterium]|nr:type II toxin-antitoxin system prevent-host-death family antitoxin [Candidatus Levybacteria bacterium]